MNVKCSGTTTYKENGSFMTESHRPDQRIAVIGLGYVGLTLATVMAEVGYDVTGVEARQDVADLTNTGQPHFAESGLSASLSGVVGANKLKATTTLDRTDPFDVYFITVGTPLDSDGIARLDMIERASTQVASHMGDGALVVLRSTVKIGTCTSIVRPILAASGKRFDLAMCPERTLEGRALEELRELPQIVGAESHKARDRAASLFGKLTNTIVRVSSLETAEIIKLVDNTSRDVQFAFANEVARVCEAFGVNAMEVISSGKLGYKRTNLPVPGLVGGPCLEKDPHILMQSLKLAGLDLEVTRASRTVNERQPRETVGFIATEINKRSFGDAFKVAVLGLAFKGVPATDDLRGSMSLKVLEALETFVAAKSISLFDPVISHRVLSQHVRGEYAYPSSIHEAVEGATVVIIANNHPHLAEMKPAEMLRRMAPNGFIYDYWNHFSSLSASELGGSYFAVGNIKRVLA